jgi:hypothetical protein
LAAFLVPPTSKQGKILMVNKADVLGAAALLIKEHGEDAWLEASSKSTDLKASGDKAGSQLWAHIADAIAAMSQEDSGGATGTKH